MSKKKKNKFKVYYTPITQTKDIQNFIKSLSELRKLNILLSKKLINQAEYEKIKRDIGFFTDY